MNKLATEIIKYGRRNWAVYLMSGPEDKELVAVTVYKRGAESVKALADALIVMRMMNQRQAMKIGSETQRADQLGINCR